MPTDEARIWATLVPEVQRGRLELLETTFDDTRLVTEAITALAYANDADREQIRNWATLLSRGGTTWDAFKANLRTSGANRERVARKLLEELPQREAEKAAARREELAKARRARAR